MGSGINDGGMWPMSRGLSRFKQTQFIKTCILGGRGSHYSLYKELSTDSAAGRGPGVGACALLLALGVLAVLLSSHSRASVSAPVEQGC